MRIFMNGSLRNIIASVVDGDGDDDNDEHDPLLLQNRNILHFLGISFSEPSNRAMPFHSPPPHPRSTLAKKN